MPLRCPTCHEALDPITQTCPDGHQFWSEDGVLILLADSFQQRLQTFLKTVERFRADERLRLLDATAYEDLPYAEAVRHNWEWRQRGYDLVNITNLLRARPSQTILDVGAWNGWLSHQLARRGHQVTAVDYFIDLYDGLKAKRFYSTRWQAIQLDLTDLSVLGQSFDVVIINHGLHFFSQPIAHVKQAQARLKPGGLLILIGLPFYQNPGPRAQQITAWQQRYRARYQAEIFLNPTKGYLDFRDKACLAKLGIKLKPYPQLWPTNLKALLKKTEPRHYFGVAQG